MATLLRLSISLLLFSSSAIAFMFQNGVVLPNDPYVFIGDELVLTCNLTRPIAEDSKSMYFTRHNNQMIPAHYTEILSSRSIRLRIPMNSPEDEGNYVCKLNKTNGATEVISFQWVIVEYKLQKVQDYKCEVYNWETMNCTWKLGVQYIHMNFIKVELVWAVSSDNYQYDCPNPTPTSCFWESDDSRDRFRWNMPYTMGIIVSSTRKGKPVTTTFPVRTDVIVKPASVQGVRISSNSSCMNIHWDHKDSRNKKIYGIQYKSPRMTKPQFLYTERKSVVLCKLKPYTWYKVNITVRPLNMHNNQTGYWSDAVAKMELTGEDVPSGAPQIRHGSYAEYPCGLRFCRKIVVYWKPVNKIYSNGRIVNYHVMQQDLMTGTKTQRKIQNVTQFELILDEDHRYKVEITAATRAGLSDSKASLTIPLKSDALPLPEDFVVEQMELNSSKHRIEMHWRKISTGSSSTKVLSYTIYWCKGAQNLQICQKPISWRVLHPNVTEVSMDFDNEALTNTLFGISVEVEDLGSSGNKVKSSGIFWNNCIFFKNSKPQMAPKNFRLSPYKPDTSIKVEWDPFQCHEAKGYILQYLLFYCEAYMDQNCTGNVVNRSISGKALFTIVTDLEEGLTYKFWIEAWSAAGSGPHTESVYTTVPLNELQAEEITGIVVAVLLVLVLCLCGVVFCIRRCYNTVKRNFQPYDIVIPNVPLPPVPSLINFPFVPSKSYHEDEEDENDSIYAKIDECDSRSSPGGGAIDVPLINNNNINTTMPKTQNHDVRRCVFKNNMYIGNNDTILNNAETLLYRLHPTLTAIYTHSQEAKFQNSDLLLPVHGENGRKKQLSDPNLLANCLPYGSVDVTDITYSENVHRKLYNSEQIHSNGSAHSDPAYRTNDLSLSPLVDKNNVTQPLLKQDDSREHFNIKLTLDRRKQPEDLGCHINSGEHNCRDTPIFHQCSSNLHVVSNCNNSEQSLDSGALDKSVNSCRSVPSYCQMDTEILADTKENDLNIEAPKSVVNGYIDHDQFNIQSTSQRFVANTLDTASAVNHSESGKCLNVTPGTRPVSQVVVVPPHFYGSLSLLDDNGVVTEL